MLLLAALSGCGSGDDASKMQAVAREQAAAPRQLAQAGSNVVTFTGNRSQYTVSLSALTVTDNVTGVVQNVPAGARLIFADTAVALDLEGNAGMAYRLYQAAFNRQPDLGGLGYWINTLDSGLSLQQVSQDFINSAEFSAAYGSLTDVGFVTQLYANVLRRAPDPGGLAFHVDYIENGTAAPGVTTRAQDLTDFSESAEDKALVLPAIQNGIEYTPDGSTPPSNPVSAFAGTYQGGFSGTDVGVLTLVFASNGTVTATGHSGVVSADISGTGMVQAGGKFSFPISGPGRTMNFIGSVNLANGLATGTWTGGNPTDFGIFHGAIVVLVVTPPPPPPPPALFTQVQAIITQRCLPCHSVHPIEPGYSAPPLGITFDSEAQIRGNAAAINANAVQSTFMPYMNATGMTSAERAVLASWFAAGTP